MRRSRRARRRDKGRLIEVARWARGWGGGGAEGLLDQQQRICETADGELEVGSSAGILRRRSSGKSLSWMMGLFAWLFLLLRIADEVRKPNRRVRSKGGLSADLRVMRPQNPKIKALF